MSLVIFFFFIMKHLVDAILDMCPFINRIKKPHLFVGIIHGFLTDTRESHLFKYLGKKITERDVISCKIGVLSAE